MQKLTCQACVWWCNSSMEIHQNQEKMWSVDAHEAFALVSKCKHKNNMNNENEALSL